MFSRLKDEKKSLFPSRVTEEVWESLKAPEPNGICSVVVKPLAGVLVKHFNPAS